MNHGEVYLSERNMKHCITYVYAITLVWLPLNEARNNLSKTAPAARRILPAGNRIEKIHID
jgi:hypothetical protein